MPAILEALATLPPGGTLVVVTHGGSARAAIGSLLDLPMDRWAVDRRPEQLLLVGARGGRPDGWRLVEHNAGSLPEPVMGDEE